MRVYTVHVDPVSPAHDRGAVLVREGFCWPAALFTVFWALYHRLWVAAVVLLAAGAALGGGLAWLGLDPASEAVVEIGYMALVGSNANDWRRRGLARRGFVPFGIVAGRDAAGAEQRLFDRGIFAAS